jgi:CRP/FNR family transcriptional regulator, dissimilatory nitrate respiration regulator
MTYDTLKQTALAHSLRSCQIFSGLSSADLEKLSSLCLLKAVEKGQYIFHQGEPSHGFYVVVRGAISIHRVSPAGKEQVIHVFRPGETFGEGTLAEEAGYPADARALESSSVLLIPKSGMLSLLKAQPELALHMLASLSRHLRILVGQIEDLTLKNVETRLGHWLLHRCPDPASPLPAEIQLRGSKKALAAELGATSETLSRTLAKFREQDLLSVQGKAILIHSVSQLAAWTARDC